MTKPIEIVLRRHSADAPVSQSLESLRPEILAALKDSRNVLDEMLAQDIAHSGGFAERLSERLERVDRLIEKLGPVKETQ